jgi:hypothetical protein
MLGRQLADAIAACAATADNALSPSERVRAAALVTVKRAPDGQKNQGAGVAVATQDRLLLAAQRVDGQATLIAISGDDIERFELRDSMLGRNWLRVQMKDGRRLELNFMGDPSGLLAVADQGFGPDVAGAVLASVGPYHVFEDRFVAPDGSYDITADVRASVDSAGNLAATRGRNLFAGAAGLVLLGPLGMLAGRAKDHLTDTRELYLLIESPDWIWGANFAPDQGAAVRQLAMAVNQAAARRDGSALPAGVGDPASRLSLLQQLGDLRASGVLNDEEFEAEKRRILEGDA